MSFPFNQPDKTRDCGYRCLYYVIKPDTSYSSWLNQFRIFSPEKSGITFTDINTVLDYYNINYKFTQLSESGLFIVYSGVWLAPEGKKHGHYFVYHDGEVFCSTKSRSQKMILSSVIDRMDAKTVEGSFRCLKILK